MDIVKNPQVDWLGLKWIFISLSLVLILIGTGSLAVAGLNLGVDFTGGTLVYLKFREQPDLGRIRSAVGGAQEVTRFGEAALNEVQIRKASIATEAEQDLTLESSQVFDSLRQEFDREPADSSRLDLNNASPSEVAARLQELDPENVRQEGSVAELAEHYDQISRRIIDYRTRQGGLIQDISQMSALGLSDAVIEALGENFYLGSFTVMSVDSVGPKVGEELRARARDAILFSLLGMLIYIAFRFKHPIYGVAAIVALAHDVFITLGVFSLAQQEISLAVIAALLTLVGYSINDTIVIFDRVRENLQSMRRSDLTAVINMSVNQTLNRTIMTSSMTFLAVMALYALGGEVLRGFSFALVVGIIIGTYSSVAIASPIVLWWQSYRERRRKRLRAH